MTADDLGPEPVSRVDELQAELNHLLSEALLTAFDRGVRRELATPEQIYVEIWQGLIPRISRFVHEMAFLHHAVSLEELARETVDDEEKAAAYAWAAETARVHAASAAIEEAEERAGHPVADEESFARDYVVRVAGEAP